MDAGLVIWVCEGSKTSHYTEVVNSEEGIILVFLQWLRTKWCIDNTRLRARLNCSEDDLVYLQNHWSIITGIPLNHFQKPILHPSNGKKGKACISIRYYDRPLLRKIREEAIKEGLLSP